MEGLPRIVVGVDFGTTYTAVAWAESSSPSQLEIITNWPTAGTLVGAQTPSEISYDDNDNTKFTWGYNISPHAWKVDLSPSWRDSAEHASIDQMVQVGPRS